MKYIIFIFFIVRFTTAQVISSHPRIFLNAETINKLEIRSAANTAEWQRLKQRMDAYMSWTGEEIISDYIGQYEYIMIYALGYYATNDQAYIDKAVDILMAFYNATDDRTIEFDSGYNSRSYLFSMALGYDWCYNAMNETQRQQIRERLIVWTDWVKTNGYAVWGSLYFEPGNNYSAGHLAGITCSGYAIYSENPTKGSEYITHSENTIADILKFINTRLSGGDANEGWSYGSGYALSLFYTFVIIKTASTDSHDYFLETTWDEEVIEFLIYATLPDRDHILPNGDWARESTGRIWDQHRSVADLISSYSDKEKARQIACYWGNETYSTLDFHNFYVWRPFLFYNNEEESLDYRTVAPFNSQYWVFTDSSGTGQFVRRSDWSNNATWVSFRAGGMYGDHAHNGNGHVEIWENGWLVIDANILSRDGTLIPDYAHNRVQIQPVSETWNLPSNSYHQAEHAEIPRREFTEAYSYIWENSTNIYKRQRDNTAVKTERQFFYLTDDNTVFTFDITETVNASYYKKNRWHFFDNPVLDDGYISYSNGIAEVFCHPIYPPSPKITIDNITVDFEYPADEAKNYFVTVLYTKASGTSAYSVNGISRDHGNVQESDLYGAYIDYGNKTNSIVFIGDNSSFNYDHLIYTVKQNESINNYAIGLKPLTNYYVTISSNAGLQAIDINISQTNGAKVIRSTENGILFFTNTGEAAIKAPKNLKLTK